MNIENLYKKYNISKDTLNDIVVCMMGNSGLSETQSMLYQDLTQEQIFAIGKFYCEHEFGMPFDELAPKWVLERYELQDARKDEVLEIIERSKELKRIKKIEEDLFYLMEERKAKNREDAS